VIGIWWLGGGADPNNGFWNIVDFHAIPNYPNPEVSPVWVVTQSPTKISLSCSACDVTRATSVAHSTSINDIQVKVVVGGSGGLASDPVLFTVNYPKEIRDRGELTVGLHDGYETRFSYQTLDIAGLPFHVPVAMNEKFVNVEDPISNNWPDFQNRGFGIYTIHSGNIWKDNVSMFTPPGGPTLNPPLISQDGTVVQQADQQWRVGTTAIGGGIYLLKADLKRRKGFATNDPLTFIPVP
jgi:hypothetical protein